MHDKRYHALSTLNDRKQAFASYREEAAEVEENEREAKLERIRTDFNEMLSACKELSPAMRFTDAAKLLSTDEVKKATAFLLPISFSILPSPSFHSFYDQNHLHLYPEC